MPRLPLPFALLALSCACMPSPAAAQSIGTFRWQLQPYCNVVTAAVTQVGAVYRLDGVDDQCGGNGAALTGDAHLNASGGVSLGFTIVTAPSGRPVLVSADIALPSANGTWQDSTGATGPFVLTAGTGTGLPRPVPLASNALPWGSTIVIGGPAATTPRGLVVAVTAPAPSVGAALAAQWGDEPSTVPSTASAVRGVSRGQIGVLGSSGFAPGVAGTSVTGMGVAGTSSSGPGVLGISATGPGVLALAAGAATSVALEVSEGAIRVSGAVAPAFTATATPANTAGHITTLDHPLLNGAPNALVLVTRLWGGTGGSTANILSPLAVFYTGTHWAVFREDGAAMPVNTRFNVLVISR
jgi:hypothetical protein